ncbi:MAG: hypothetical protein PVI23_12125 [Maricaulaceae bacterium]|jgi:hypothetical protein
MTEITYTQANKRYRAVFTPLIIIYGVLCFVGPILFTQFGEPPLWARVALAIVTAAPIGLCFLVMWRYLRETDEFTRLQQLTSLAAAGMITASFAVLWGFLELYEAAPTLWIFLLGPMFFGINGLVYKWRARNMERAA